MVASAHRPIEVHGHRGARGLLPENTLDGFEYAYECGVQSVELDVGCTLDSELVIFHDVVLNPDLVRTDDGQFIDRSDIALRSRTLAQLGQYDVGLTRPGSDYAARFPEQQPLKQASIPTLKSVLELVRDLPGSPYLTIELKSTPVTPGLCAPPSLVARRLIATLDQLAVPIERDLVTSFDWRVLAAVQDLEPSLRTSYLTIQQPDDNTVDRTEDPAKSWTGEFDISNYDGQVATMVADAGGNGWSPYFMDISAELVEDAHSRGLMVSVWTVNEPHDIDRMIECGVDVIITDYPQRALDQISAHNRSRNESS